MTPEYKFERALTIVVPALNEAASIRSVIESLVAAASDCLDRFEIIAVDDGSTDRTGAILDELCSQYPQLIVIHHAERQGIGAGFHAALARASTPFITVIPGDGAYAVDDLRHAFQAVGKASHVGFIRTNQRAARGLVRWLLSKSYNFLVGWLLQFAVSDIHGSQVFSVEKLRRANLHQKEYMFGIEALDAVSATPDDLVEVRVALNANDPRSSRSFRLSTLFNLVMTLVHYRQRILPGLASPPLLFLLLGYSLLLAVACLQFTGVPNLQDLASLPGRQLFLYYAATIVAFPALCLFPVCLGQLTLSFVSIRSNVARPTTDQILLAAVSGVGIAILLGTALGAAGLLHQKLLLPLVLSTILVGLLRHPRLFAPFIDWALARDAEPRLIAAAVRGLMLFGLALVLVGIALPVELISTDVMQIYYAFLARVKSTGDFWIRTASPDVSDFLIGRGNGIHLIFAALLHPYVGGLIGFAYFAGILALVRRIAAIAMDAAIAEHADLQRGAWHLLPDLLVLAAIFSSLLRADFAKYHLQIGFLLTGSIYLIVLYLRQDTRSRSLALLFSTAVVAAALPVILPQYIAFVMMLLGAAIATSILQRDRQSLFAAAGLFGVALLACAVSLGLNYLHVGAPELYPSALFLKLTDFDKFAQFSSAEIWRYLNLAQDLEDSELRTIWPKLEVILQFYHSNIGRVFLLGMSWGTLIRAIDIYKDSVANSAWILFASASLLSLLATGVWSRIYSGGRLLSTAIIALFGIGALAALPSILTCGLNKPCIAHAFPGTFFSNTLRGNILVAVAISIYGIIVGGMAAIISASITTPKRSAPYSTFGMPADLRFLGLAILSLLLIFIGSALLYALAPAPSLTRLYLTFAASRPIFLFLLLCVVAVVFFSVRTVAIEYGRHSSDRLSIKVGNWGSVFASLALFALFPGVLVAALVRVRGADLALAMIAGSIYVPVAGLAYAIFLGFVGPQPDTQPMTHRSHPIRRRTSKVFGVSLRRWGRLDAQFVSLAMATILVGLIAVSFSHERRTFMRSYKNLSHVLGDQTALETSRQNWNFERCLEVAEIVKGRGHILAVNAPEKMVPCYAPIGLPRATFLHHYNSILAPRYRLVLYGEPREVESYFRAHDVNYFYVDRRGNDYMWGHGFSRLFDADSLLAMFDIEHESDEYYLLTWRGAGKRPVGPPTAEEVQLLRRIGATKFPLARRAYETLGRELRQAGLVSPK